MTTRISDPARIMGMTDILDSGAIYPELEANSRSALLHELAAKASKLVGSGRTQHPQDLANALMQRERLGSTGMAGGVAIPHARIEGIDKVIGLFARLKKPIEFESADGEPVDLVFMLLAPKGAGADHLKALARVSRILREESVRTQLREATDAKQIYSILTLDRSVGSGSGSG